MRKESLVEALQRIVKDDPRYHLDAYLFVREALDVTVKMLNKPTEGSARHVSGIELLEGVRVYALQEYGPMAFRVLDSWGVRRTEDIGAIVFNLVAKGILGKTDQDRREDFDRGYDFREAFVDPFLPPSALRQSEKDAKPNPPIARA